MSDRYLWDRSGEPDPEIERLEKLLSPFALSARARSNRRWMAIAAGIAAIAGLAAWQWTLHTRPPSVKSAWQLIHSGSAPIEIYTGQLIRTDAHTTAELHSDLVGQVRLEPGSEAYVRESTPSRQLLMLRRGVMHAFIWAPPSQFAVDTPGVRAIDLGCAYTLSTNTSGDGLITVQTGWVAFDHDRHESFIPAGAVCRVSGERGPGIPWFEDAPQPFRDAVRNWERDHSVDNLAAILATARPHDAITLWHLMSRVDTDQRAQVFDRFSELLRVPSKLRAGVIAGDHNALDVCWNALQLGNTSWWRTWKRIW